MPVYDDTKNASSRNFTIRMYVKLHILGTYDSIIGTYNSER